MERLLKETENLINETFNKFGYDVTLKYHEITEEFVINFYITPSGVSFGNFYIDGIIESNDTPEKISEYIVKTMMKTHPELF